MLFCFRLWFTSFCSILGGGIFEVKPEDVFANFLKLVEPSESKNSQGLSRAWIRCPSGRRVDLLDPSPLDIEVTDIALSLSRISRWAGMTVTAHGFSVAQHSVFVVKILDWMLEGSAKYRKMVKSSGFSKKHWLLAALMHDAAEAYLGGDLCGPAKANMKSTEYRDMEEALQRAVFIAVGLPAELPPGMKRIIKYADRASAYAEALLIVGFSEEEAEMFFGVRTQLKENAFLTSMSSEEAMASFLSLYKRLKIV